MIRILVIRPGAIGDSLLTFPVLQTLRDQAPEKHIIFVSNAAVLPLAKTTQLADEVFDYGDPLWSELFFPAITPKQRLHSILQTIDIAICWLHDSDGIVEHNLSSIGIQGVFVAPGRPPAGSRTHIVDYLFQTIAMTTPKTYKPLKLALPGQTVERRDIAVHPGSGGPQKCWPIPSFAALIRQLWLAEFPVLLLAGPADHERLEELLAVTRRLREDEQLLKVLLDTPLLELAQQLLQCCCYIGNDSGITHLAALLGVPTLALFGPSDPVVWHPIGPSVRILYEPQLEDIHVDIVMNACMMFMRSP